ncbi:MAG: hypothetical protein EOO09_07270 [Chitinophagaceae bacterium]|nr:MAG: hypothetical protein EOO09_07270 [Chitinophagaceae bacterium]
MKRIVITLTSLLLLHSVLPAQDTLPAFSLRNVGGNRIIIGWTNPFGDSIRQVSVQRSFDSLKNFRTILTLPDPTTPQNGIVDTKAFNDHMFYRIYIMLDGGRYLFSVSKRPVKDTISAVITQPQSSLGDSAMLANPDFAHPGFARPGSTRFTPGMIRNDSIAGPAISNNRPKAELFVASKRVFTFPDGYVKIVLPDKEGKKYRIRFLTMDDKLLFEIKEPKEREFKIDKTSFYRSGWYRFELFEDEELLEKHRFYLPREF